jgi:HD domain
VTTPITAIAPLDALLAAHADALGGDFAGYRNHAYRVANICAALSAADPVALDKIAVAAALHDIGIWTDGTFDYLAPSVRLATAHLARAGRADWTAEITAMIFEHHKLTRWQGPAGWLVEPFRRADWADVSRGVLARGVPRGLIGALYATWPSAGFHRRVVELELGRLGAHPLNPLPMLRL